MDTIRNYLESMFAELPNTPDVQKAKSELWQMMDDKYSELISEGKAENEAVGIVISEFGNLDEIADSLGIRGYMNGGSTMAPGRKVSLDEAKRYISQKSAQGFTRGLAVFLLITCPVGFILAIPVDHATALAVATVYFFASIAAGVALIVYGSIKAKSWSFLNNEQCSLDFNTVDYIDRERQHNRTSYAMLITIGIILCVMSIVPISVFPMLHDSAGTMAVGSSLVFILVGLGVMMMIYASTRHGSYNTLLRVNPAGTMGANFVSSQQGEVSYTSPVAEAVMSEFNLTVLCLYLIWSFLTFDWLITWIIWPISAIVKSVIQKAYLK